MLHRNVSQISKEVVNGLAASIRRLWGRGVLFCLWAMTSPLWAANDLVPPELKTMGDNVVEIFTGDIARIIMSCCFGGACIAYGYNKDNEKMKGKMVAVLVATTLLLLSSVIIKKLWEMKAN